MKLTCYNAHVISYFWCQSIMFSHSLSCLESNPHPVQPGVPFTQVQPTEVSENISSCICWLLCIINIICNLNNYSSKLYYFQDLYIFIKDSNTV